eukprot:TRINITY_DN64147_c0_g1_i1.p2 TRINITY_DN64147_c0_g1~~TRINITY_DN64147_c0_g1_i1.p2  ORF type:complete len:736 (-),score=63.94 TRINITY_DN64147_c0_g1_i1:3295-5502(-)
MDWGFTDTKFDAKKWINDALKEKKDDSAGAVSFVFTMILKLQLLAQEASSSFEEISQQALMRMPRALLEIERMSKEARTLRQNLNLLVQGEMSEAQRTTMQSIETMNALHEVKRQLDVCQQTISQVGYLSQNLDKMNATFEQGTTTQIGEEISRMQAGLKALEDYPDQHSKFNSQIKGFEMRLMKMIEQDCKRALIQHNIPEAKAHLGTLQKIGKLDAVVREFVKHVIQPVLQFWEAFDNEPATLDNETTTVPDEPPPSLPDWLPSFFTEVKGIARTERQYYTNVFGNEHYAEQLANMIATIWQSLQPTFETRIKSLSLPHIVQAFTSSRTFFNYCGEEIISQAPQSQQQQLWVLLESVIFKPYLDAQLAYPQKEKDLLLSYVKKFQWVGRVDDTANLVLTTGLVVHIADGNGNLFVHVEEAVQRCLEFTDGIECQGLVKSITEVFTEYCRMISIVLQAHSQNSQMDASEGANIDTTPVKVALHFYQVINSFISKLQLFEKIVYKEILQCSGLSSLVSGSSTSSPSTGGLNIQLKPRLLRECPDKAAPLSNFLRSIEQLNCPLFSDARNSFQLLCKEAEELVFKILLVQVQHQLQGIPQMEIWSASDDKFTSVSGIAGAESVSMGSISPSEYIRAVGDYVCELPVLLEDDEGGDDDVDTYIEGKVGANYWLEIVCNRSVEMYLTEIGKIPTLGSYGNCQLLADVEYLENILNTFGFELPALEDFITRQRKKCPQQ